MSDERRIILNTVRELADGQVRDLAKQLAGQVAGQWAREMDAALEPLRYAPAGIGHRPKGESK